MPPPPRPSRRDPVSRDSGIPEAREGSHPESDPARDDADIILASCDDPDLFAVIFDRHVDEIHRYVTRRLGGAVAEDVVAETFLVAFRQRERFRTQRRDARPWLYGIATNLIRRHQRGEVRRYRAMQRLRSVPDEESHADRVTTEVSMAGLRRQLGDALQRLRTGDRDVLLLIAWEELSYEETAEALRIPIGTVRSRLNRARRKIRDALDGVDPIRVEEDKRHG